MSKGKQYSLLIYLLFITTFSFLVRFYSMDSFIGGADSGLIISQSFDKSFFEVIYISFSDPTFTRVLTNIIFNLATKTVRDATISFQDFSSNVFYNAKFPPIIFGSAILLLIFFTLRELGLKKALFFVPLLAMISVPFLSQIKHVAG